MRLFAISDLHLPGGMDKSMDRFGPGWVGHFDKISADWRSRVTPQDLVLLPGDLSWAMAFDDALADIDAICALPGRKILLKGNHDYWWGSVSRLRSKLPEGVYAIQNDAVTVENVTVAGSRGWEYGAQADEKVMRREVLRMQMSLQAAAARPSERLVAMMHFPPFDEHGRLTPFTELFEAYGVSDVVYGHLHGPGVHAAKTGKIGTVRYHLVSCDALDFALCQLPG